MAPASAIKGLRKRQLFKERCRQTSTTHQTRCPMTRAQFGKHTCQLSNDRSHRCTCSLNPEHEQKSNWLLAQGTYQCGLQRWQLTSQGFARTRGKFIHVCLEILVTSIIAFRCGRTVFNNGLQAGRMQRQPFNTINTVTLEGLRCLWNVWR